MNKQSKERYEFLKERNRINCIEKNWRKNVLLKECIEVTGAEVLRYTDGEYILNLIQKKIPFNNYGKVDFGKFKYIKNIDINSLENIFEFIAPYSEIYIMWDRLDLPCVKGVLSNIVKHIDDVLAVSFDTWILSVDYNVIIEFHHEGVILLGVLE